jgi:hypothetical protein
MIYCKEPAGLSVKKNTEKNFFDRKVHCRREKAPGRKTGAWGLFQRTRHSCEKLTLFPGSTVTGLKVGSNEAEFAPGEFQK